MTLQQLEYFRIMAKVLHFTKAAEILYISQPSLSYAIDALEKELGVPLFERNGRQTVLTEYGTQFYHYVENGLGSLMLGRQKLSQMNDTGNGVVVISYIDEIGYDFLPDLIKQFHSEESNRNIRFKIYLHHNSSIISMLLDGSIDLAFSMKPDLPQIKFIPLVEQDLVLIIPYGHPLESLGTIRLEEIRNYPLVVTEKGTSLRKITDEMLAEASIIPNIVFEAEECNAMAAFVGAGLGVALIAKTPLLNKYKASPIHISFPHRTRIIGLLYNEARYMSPAVIKFRDYAIDYLQYKENK